MEKTPKHSPPNSLPPLDFSWAGFRWDSAYARLPETLRRPTAPTPVAAPALVVLNEELASLLGLEAEALASPDGVAFLAGNRLVENVPTVAEAYAGHQFGYFTILGDGRAILAGDHGTRDGRRVDLQWKGSGRTAFSRGGDGRLALGPALREYLVSEAMAALGVPTTRSLAVVTTGEQVLRETAEAGAVLMRVASSHVRVGTFEWALVGEDPAALPALVDYCLDRHGPALDLAAPLAEKTRRLFQSVIDRQASLVARWMAVGFVHGVMNTDNTAISGETIDFGPCAFLDRYDPSAVFSSIDEGGRYAYGRQPSIAAWNLARLGDTLLPLLSEDREQAVEQANAILATFPDRFATHFTEVFGGKLGLAAPKREDMALVQDLLAVAEAEKLDFHATWNALTDGVQALEAESDARSFALPLRPWAIRWRARLAAEASFAEVLQRLRKSNPRVVPRNHRVEEALARAKAGDFGPFRRLLLAVRRPFADDADARELGAPPAVFDPSYRTFCGT